MISISFDKKSETSGFILECTVRRMKQVLQQRLSAESAGITVDQWVLLQEVERQPGINQLDLAKATFKDAPTVTRILDLLVEKGLITRLPDPSDRRKFRIELTAAGQHKFREVLPLIRDFRQQVWAGLENEELDQLMGILRKMMDNLE